MPAVGEEGRIRGSSSLGSQVSQSLISGPEDIGPVRSHAQGVGVHFALLCPQCPPRMPIACPSPQWMVTLIFPETLDVRAGGASGTL